MLKPVVSYFFILSGIFTGFFLSFIYLIYKFLVRYDFFSERKLSLAIFPHILFNLMALNTCVISRNYVRANGQCFGSFRMFKRATGQTFGILRIFKRINRQAFGILRMIKLTAGQCFGNSRMFKREGKQRFGRLYLIEFNHYQNKIIYRILVAAGVQVFLSALWQNSFLLYQKNQKFNTL